MPGNAGRAEVAHVPGVERQVVAHDIAMMDRERRPGVEHAGQDLVTHIAEFRHVGRLRVGEQQGVEALRLPLAPQREIDRRWKRSCRRNACMTKLERRGGPIGLVEVGEPRNAARAERRRPVRRLDHEQAVAARDGEAPAAILLGQDDIPTVGDHHTWDAGIVRLATLAAAAILEDETSGDNRSSSRSGPISCRSRQQPRRRCGSARYRLAPRERVATCRCLSHVPPRLGGCTCRVI
jgi:hypothetical protein